MTPEELDVMELKIKRAKEITEKVRHIDTFLQALREEGTGLTVIVHKNCTAELMYPIAIQHCVSDEMRRYNFMSKPLRNVNDCGDIIETLITLLLGKKEELLKTYAEI